MTARHLARVMPGARVLPYTGMYDVIGGDTVSFHFPEGSSRGLVDQVVMVYRKPDDDAPLQAVSRFDYLASADEAGSRWRALTAALLSSSIGSTATCYEYTHGITPALAALAHSDSVWVGTILYPDDPKRDMRTGKTVYRSVVRTFLTSAPTIFVPSTIEKRQVPCS